MSAVASNQDAEIRRYLEFKRVKYDLNLKRCLRGRENFNALGYLRTKPGRRDSEFCSIMSCSDKIARWICLGLGGALLSYFMDAPIFLSGIIVGEGYCRDDLERALISRTNEWRRRNFKDGCVVPTIEETHVDFPFSLSKKSELKGDTSITWIKGQEVEVLVNGRKQGFTNKKGEWSAKSISRLAKSSLHKLFLAANKIKVKEKNSYSKCKQNASVYQEKKASLLFDTFKGWLHQMQIEKEEI